MGNETYESDLINDYEAWYDVPASLQGAHASLENWRNAEVYLDSLYNAYGATAKRIYSLSLEFTKPQGPFSYKYSAHNHNRPKRNGLYIKCI